VVNNFDVADFAKEFNSCCSKTQIKEFNKGETITTYLVNRNQLCILISGTADLVRYDINGNKVVTEHFSKDAIFGEIFYDINTNSEFIVEAKEKCTVLFFLYDDINVKCKSNCSYHKTLVASMPSLIITKIMDLTSRVDLLSRRTTRDKLLRVFWIIIKKIW